MAFTFTLLFLILQISCKEKINHFKIKSNNNFQSKNIEPLNKQKLIYQNISNDNHSNLSNYKYNIFTTPSPERNLIFILIICEIIVGILIRQLNQVIDLSSYHHVNAADILL